MAQNGMEGWRAIQFDDIPKREEFEQLTLDLLAQGITNSDRIRDIIRRQRKLILSPTTGHWNDNPSDKFVNEHAWALKNLVEKAEVKLVASKEYVICHR